jgi:hypothetical protein
MKHSKKKRKKLKVRRSNPVAKDLRTPKYRLRVVKSKKEKFKNGYDGEVS